MRRLAVFAAAAFSLAACAQTATEEARAVVALHLLAAGAGRAARPSRPRRRPLGARRLAAGRSRQSAGDGAAGGRPGRHRARARFRAGPCRQRPRLRPRRLVERRPPSTGCRTIMSRNGAMATPRSRFPAAWSARRRPNMTATSPGCRSARSAFPTATRRWPAMSNGWPVAYDPENGRAWLTHCYASVGVGRDLAPDTGTGGELYAVIGHAPRHLDRNIATVGRVIEGIGLLSARPRGTGQSRLLRGRPQRSADPDPRHPPRQRHARGGAAALRGDALRQRRLLPLM